MTNAALERVFGALCGNARVHRNVVRQVFDPRDMRPFIGNWEEVAGDLIRHVHDDIAAAPSDSRLRAVLDEALSHEGVPPSWRRRPLGASRLPILTATFRNRATELRFFSTLTLFGTTRDVTVEEVRIECMFPADDATARFCRGLTR
jgi:hypothetical protein